MRFLLVLLALTLSTGLHAELRISDAWIKNLPPSVPVRAGYLTLFNPTTNTRVVLGFDSPAFARIELHRTVSEDGMMRMEAVDELRLDPGARLRLEPGGLHLMMMQASEPTRPGDRIPVSLRFADGRGQAFEMTVRE